MKHMRMAYLAVALLLVLGVTLVQAAGPADVAVSIPDGSMGNEDVSAVPLGQPGLSFRYVHTFGVTEEAYPADAVHLNSPHGLFIDASDNLYVAEQIGIRLLKYNAAGQNTLTLGRAGLGFAAPDYLNWLMDVAVDADGNIWVTIPNALNEHDASGNLVQLFPWDVNSGTTNDRFNDPWGIAFDASNRLFVADKWNHRIQVYTINASGGLVYNTTIGVTGVPKSDNTGFDRPNLIAFDSLERLYVMDSANHRVQRCTEAGGWTCATFFGVTDVPGSDSAHLNYASGITIDDGDNIYLVDGNNHRVLKCSTAGSCSHFTGVNGESGSDNNHFDWPQDAAVDSAGNVYVSDFYNHRIQKFNSSGAYVGTIGVTRTPYVADTSRIYTPDGVAAAPDGSLYVTEGGGQRLLKLAPSGEQEWAIGQPGVRGFDNAHFNSPQGSPAVDAAGYVYISDTDNGRVQIFTPGGAYAGSFGSPGTGNYQFHCPTGVAIGPSNGFLYVTDRCNQRVKVYNSSRVYQATLGETGVSGSDNAHFNEPRGVAVDASGNIYIADRGNLRVQKCTLNGSAFTCKTFAGETGVAGGDFGHLYPLGVAADGAGRVYVADEHNHRVQVYDSSGAYLTTIGNRWGARTGELRHPAGVNVDRAGNVYMAERSNHRVQKYALGVPGWRQSNINGFGDPQNRSIFSLGPFGGQLYAGTYNLSGNGAQLWRTGDGVTWTPVMTTGLGNAYNVAVDHVLEFNSNLYAGTVADEVNGGEVWRSDNGLNWTRVVSQGFGDPTNAEVYRFAIFNNQLYASTWSWTDTHGTELWRSGTGNAGDWMRVAYNGFNGDANNVAALSLEVFNGNLYAGTWNTGTGGEVWRSNNGTTWTQVNTDGFGTANNRGVSALTAFKGYLYAATRGNPDVAGDEVWRCQVCNGGDWTKVVNNGFGNTDTNAAAALEVLNGYLYLVAGNESTGVEVWRTADGADWQQLGFGGFGDSNNGQTYWDNSIAVFNGSLFIGTWNDANGGEVWMTLHQVYLPLVVRGYR